MKDPREAAREKEIRNVTIGLFSAALLVGAAACLLLLSEMAGGLKAALLVAATVGYYGAGLTVLARKPMLRAAAIGFVGIGLVLVPFIGVGIHRWLLPESGSLSALLASIAGILMYSYAAVRLSSRVLGYLSVVSVMSFGVAFGASLQKGMLFSLCALIVLSTLVKLVLLQPRIRIPAVLRAAYGDLGPWYAPLLAVTTAATALLGGVNLTEFAVALTLLGIHSAVSYALGRRNDDLAGVRFAVVAVPLIWMVASRVPWPMVLTVAALLAAVHAVAFTRDDAVRRAAPWWTPRTHAETPLSFVWSAAAALVAAPVLASGGGWARAAAVLLAVALVSVALIGGRRRRIPNVLAAVLAAVLVPALTWAWAASDLSRAAEWVPFCVLTLALAVVAVRGFALGRDDSAASVLFLSALWPVLLVSWATGWRAFAIVAVSLLVLARTFALPPQERTAADVSVSPGRTGVMVWGPLALASSLVLATHGLAMLLYGEPLRWLLVAALAGAVWRIRPSKVGEGILVFLAVAVAMTGSAGGLARSGSLTLLAFAVAFAVVAWRRGCSEDARSAAICGAGSLVIGGAGIDDRSLMTALPFGALFGYRAVLQMLPAGRRLSAGRRPVSAWLMLGCAGVAILPLIGAASVSTEYPLVEAWSAGALLCVIGLGVSLALTWRTASEIWMRPALCGLLTAALILLICPAVLTTTIGQSASLIAVGGAMGVAAMITETPRVGWSLGRLISWALLLVGMLHGACAEATGWWGVLCMAVLVVVSGLVAVAIPVADVIHRGTERAVMASLLAGSAILPVVQRDLWWLLGALVLVWGVVWCTRWIMAGGPEQLRWGIPLSALGGAELLGSGITSWGVDPLSAQMAILALAGGISWGALLQSTAPRVLAMAVPAVFFGVSGLLGMTGHLGQIMIGWLLLAAGLFVVQRSGSLQTYSAAFPGAWILLGALGAARVLHDTTGDWEPVLLLLVTGAALGLWPLVRQDAELRQFEGDAYGYLAAAFITFAALFGMERTSFERSVALVGLVGIVLIGLLRRMPVLTVWGALCLCFSLVIFLTNYTMMLMVLLALLVSGLAVWRLRSLK